MTLTIPHPRTPDEDRPPRWDALDVPYEAGLAVLDWADRADRADQTAGAGPAARAGVLPGPVLAAGGRMLLLVPEGSADELPGLLHWLEWDGVELDLRAHESCETPRGTDRRWVRPPGNGSSATPAGADLARLVSVVATECHRLRLVRAARPGGPDQADAFSYASRMLAGTRPRSFTS